MTYEPPSLEASGSASVELLRGRHEGETAWIVGKGPSLALLRASDIGPGPVIAINEAIGYIQRLGLPQQVYAFQKEGCEVRDEQGNRPCGSCAPLGWQRAPLIDPYPGVITIFGQYLASWCLHGRPNRYVYPTDQWGYGETPHVMSVLEAIPFALHLGAVRLVMVAFDSMTVGVRTNVDDERYTDEQRAAIASNLDWQVPRVLDALAGVPHEWLTPGR